MIIKSFKDEWESLKKIYENGSFEYNDTSHTFSSCVDLHFRSVKRQQKYGVYLVRQRDTGEILYIGKSGTINSKGQFLGQDIPDRLKNVKDGRIPANQWFKDLCVEKGPLVIEYIFLPVSNSPALIEAILLQAYLNEYNHLPYKNKKL
ncbi:MAG: hypothetical protein QXV01_07375 [Candidatus Bathyarchaeia archaeon]